MSDMQVATEILRQLGGARFVAMTGARNLVGREDFLRFDIPGRRQVAVFLTANDTYTVYVMKVNRKANDYVILAERDDVYCDSLQDTFTALTGLYTRL